MSTDQNNARPKLLLIDGSNLMFRSFHALPNLRAPSGQPTGALVGTFNTLESLLNQIEPTYVAVVFDCREPTFRHQLYPAYKGNRQAMPEDLAEQIDLLHEFIAGFGWTVIKYPGFEADDIIATLAHHAVHHLDVWIVSTDKDLAQLVAPHCTMIHPNGLKKLDRAGVYEKFGIWPEQILDYLTLIGDHSDNIPGIPGVGPKTAQKWLATFQDIPTIYTQLAQLPVRLQRLLSEHQSQLELSRQLLSLKADVPVSLDWGDYRIQSPDPNTLSKLNELGMTRQMQKIKTKLAFSSAVVTPSEQPPYQILQSIDALHTFLKNVHREHTLVIDCETDGLDPHLAKLIGIGLSFQPKQAVYIPLGHAEGHNLAWEQVRFELSTAHQQNGWRWGAHHLKFDWQILYHHGLEITGKIADSMIAAYLINPSAKMYGLKSLVQHHFGHTMVAFEELTSDPTALAAESIDKLGSYCAADADWTGQLIALVEQELKKDNVAFTLYETIDMPLVLILARMEYTGVSFDLQELLRQKAQIGMDIEQNKAKISQYTDSSINLDSPKQLGQLLFQQLKLPVISRTSKGEPSTAEQILRELAGLHPIIPLLLQYRQQSKLFHTYLEKLPQCIHPITGRIHTNWLQTATTTGRLASAKPNLQTLPIRSEEGGRIRHAVICRADHCLISADYSQIELRLLAHFSGDQSLIHAFSHGLDIHRATASQLLGVPLDQINHQQRRLAKTINFGLIYGMSAHGLAKQLSISRDQAKLFLDRYFEEYSGVKSFMDTIQQDMIQGKPIKTLFGRTLHFEKGLAKNQAALVRQAINAPMQASCAEMIKQAMISAQNQLNQINGFFILQIHDELVVELPLSYVEEGTATLRDAMMSAATLRVPLAVSIGHGQNWTEAHPA